MSDLDPTLPPPIEPPFSPPEENLPPEVSPAHSLPNSYVEFNVWFGNQKIKYHCEQDDKKVREYKEWYSNGKIKIHCWYNDNQVSGEYKEWDDKEKLKTHKWYESGSEIDIKDNPELKELYKVKDDSIRNVEGHYFKD